MTIPFTYFVMFLKQSVTLFTPISSCFTLILLERFVKQKKTVYDPSSCTCFCVKFFFFYVVLCLLEMDIF